MRGAILLAALALSGCMTAAQKRDRAEAETAIADAVAALASARRAGAPRLFPEQWSSSEADLASARERFAKKAWPDARHRARIAEQAARDMEATASKPKSTPSLPPRLKPARRPAKPGKPR
jgi:nicotinamidase-related amidase